MKENYQAFIVLAICGIFLFLKYIAQLFPSLISTILIEHYKMSGVQVGILASSYYYSYTLMQLISGIALDRYSLRMVSALSIFTIALGLLIFPNTHSFWSMCLSRAMMGVGCSFATTLYIKAATLWVSDKAFSFISSLLATATMVGAAVGAAPIAILFDNLGWQQGLLYIAVIAFGVALSALLFVKNKNPIQTQQAPTFKNIKKVIYNRNNLYLLLYNGLTFTPVIALGGLWGVPFLEIKFSITASSSAQLISLMFLGHAIGSPVWALLSHILNNQKQIMVLANICAFISLCALLYLPGTYTSAQFLFFGFGFCVGAFMLSFDLCRQINSAALMGFAVAFINSGEGIVASALEPGIGLLLDGLKLGSATQFSLSNYQIALSCLPGCFLLSTAVIYKLPFTEKLLQELNYKQRTI